MPYVFDAITAKVMALTNYGNNVAYSNHFIKNIVYHGMDEDKIGE